MPRQTPLDNIGPNDLAYEIAPPDVAPPGMLPVLVVVSTHVQPGSSADKVQITTSAFQVDGNGRPVLDEQGRRVTIDEAVDEFARDGYLYQHRRDMSMAAATRFELALVAIPQTAPQPVAPVPPAPAPAPVIAADVPVATSVQPGAPVPVDEATP